MNNHRSFHTDNNIYSRMNSSTIMCESKNTTQVYFFTVHESDESHVPNTCTCSYRYRGQKCTHLRELSEYLAFERSRGEDDRKVVNGVFVEPDGDLLFLA